VVLNVAFGLGARQIATASFAARFTALVGEPPLAYLTRWRMQWPPICSIVRACRSARLRRESATSRNPRSVRRSSARQVLLPEPFRRQRAA